MKVLILAKQFPYPLNDGASIAIHMLSRGLVEGGASVDLISFNTSKHPYGGPVDIPQLSHYDSIDMVPIDNRPSLLGAFANLFSSRSYHLSRFEDDSMKTILTNRLTQKKYDVVQVESTHMLIYLEHIVRVFDGPIILRAHNVEHIIWERSIKNERNWLKRWYLSIQTQSLKTFEVITAGQVDGIASVSDVDTGFFLQSNSQAKTIPIGLEFAPYRDPQESRAPIFGFIGSMDWQPNYQGLEWFFSNVLQEISDQTKLLIAGRGLDSLEDSFNQYDQVEILGEVDDVSSFWNSIDVLIVPLLSGSGTRVKIIEAVAKSKLVLSTPIGAEGLPLKHMRHAVIHEDPREWVHSMNHVIDNWKDYTILIKRAHDQMLNDYDYKKIAKDAVAWYGCLIEDKKRKV